MKKLFIGGLKYPNFPPGKEPVENNRKKIQKRFDENKLGLTIKYRGLYIFVTNEADDKTLKKAEEIIRSFFGDDVITAILKEDF